MWSLRRRRPVTYLQGAPVRSYPDVPPEVGRGRVLRITEIGEDVLATPCREVTAFGTPELARLVDDLFATMDAAEGVGLAANQAGVDLRVFVYDLEDEEGDRHVGHVVNPVLEILSSAEDPEDPEGTEDVGRGARSSADGRAGDLGAAEGRGTEGDDADEDDVEEDEEGCLSVPGAYSPLARPWSARVRGVDQHGEPLVLEADGYLARCFQHEAQHLDGQLYVDLLPDDARADVIEQMHARRPGILEGRRLRTLERGKEPATYPAEPLV